MPTKAEVELSEEQVREICARLFRTPGGKQLKTITKVLAEHGVMVSPTSGASSFRDGPLKNYLEELAATRDFADNVAQLTKNGVGISDGAASAFAGKVFKAAIAITEDEIGGKKANNVSLAINRLRSGDQRARYLETQLAAMRQKMELEQFDAAAAVLANAKEIKLIVADTKLDQAAKTDRVRKILFGERPSDWKPVTTTGGQAT